MEASVLEMALDTNVFVTGMTQLVAACDFKQISYVLLKIAMEIQDK